MIRTYARVRRSGRYCMPLIEEAPGPKTMDDTPNLNLPYIMAAQAQKHVTHNEAIRALDAVVQIAVADRDLTIPPASPAEGDRYIVAAGATGAWAGSDGKLAAWQDGAWMLYAPLEGWLAWVADEDALLAWDGSVWTSAAGGGASAFTALTDTPSAYTSAAGKMSVVRSDEMGLEFSDEVAQLGVNATPDASNKLAISSDASLFNHAGAGHQHKINKNAASDTASLLFQTGFSGRAEFGTTGDDDWHVKVSPDGSTWQEAIVVDKTSGELFARGGIKIGPNEAGQSIVRFTNAAGEVTDQYNSYIDGNFYIDHPQSTGRIDLRTTTGYLSRLAIAASGNVGIGMTSPAVKLDVDGPIRVKSYTVATVPSAAAAAGQIIYISDESGGAVIAFSDGTNWLRATDRAVIS
jgi:Protein of unknown function (DUF2793)